MSLWEKVSFLRKIPVTVRIGIELYNSGRGSVRRVKGWRILSNRHRKRDQRRALRAVRTDRKVLPEPSPPEKAITVSRVSRR